MPWSEIATIARRLIDREFTGKAVLHLVCAEYRGLTVRIPLLSGESMRTLN
jgi:hypothetical protein